MKAALLRQSLDSNVRFTIWTAFSCFESPWDTVIWQSLGTAKLDGEPTSALL